MIQQNLLVECNEYLYLKKGKRHDERFFLGMKLSEQDLQKYELLKKYAYTKCNINEIAWLEKIELKELYRYKARFDDLIGSYFI